MKTYTQQELEKYARQKQLELLDEMNDVIVKTLHFDVILRYDLSDMNADKIVTKIHNFITKKREQLTSDNKL